LEEEAKRAKRNKKGKREIMEEPKLYLRSLIHPAA
jgi:hypothetical protein